MLHFLVFVWMEMPVSVFMWFSSFCFLSVFRWRHRCRETVRDVKPYIHFQADKNKQLVFQVSLWKINCFRNKRTLKDLCLLEVHLTLLSLLNLVAYDSGAQPLVCRPDSVHRSISSIWQDSLEVQKFGARGAAAALIAVPLFQTFRPAGSSICWMWPHVLDHWPAVGPVHGGHSTAGFSITPAVYGRADPQTSPAPLLQPVGPAC